MYRVDEQAAFSINANVIISCKSLGRGLLVMTPLAIHPWTMPSLNLTRCSVQLVLILRSSHNLLKARLLLQCRMHPASYHSECSALLLDLPPRVSCLFETPTAVQNRYSPVTRNPKWR